MISRIDTEGMRESPYFPRFPITLGQLIQNSDVIIAECRDLNTLSTSPELLRSQPLRMDSLTGQQLLGKDEKVVSADSVLEDKRIIAFYFSAHWCPPCRWADSPAHVLMLVCKCFSQTVHSTADRVLLWPCNLGRRTIWDCVRVQRQDPRGHDDLHEGESRGLAGRATRYSPGSATEEKVLSDRHPHTDSGQQASGLASPLSLIDMK